MVARAFALLVLSLSLSLCALGARADALDEARSKFADGVAFAEARKWEQAAQAFESSLRLADRAGTRANLVRAYSELGRPLDVARHALVFLALPNAPHRADVRKAVEGDLRHARSQLAVLTIGALPEGTVLLVDGRPPALQTPDEVFLSSGPHRLEARVPGADPELIEIHLAPGQSIPWPRQIQQARAVPSPAEVAAAQHEAKPAEQAAHSAARPDDGRWRSKAAWTLGLLGASVGVAAGATHWVAAQRAERVRDMSSSMSGFLDAASDYENARQWVAPLALTSGVLTAQAVAFGPRLGRRESKWWAAGALAIGSALISASATLVFRPTDTLGERSNVDPPQAQSGALFAGAALPFFSYGVTSLIRGRSPAK